MNLSTSLYGNYISERSNGKILENDFGFIAYRTDQGECYIIEMYIKPEFRRSKKGTELFSELELIARKERSRRIVAGIYIEDACSTITIAAAISAGFKIFSANGGIIQIEKPVIYEEKPFVLNEKVSFVGFEFDKHFELIKSWFEKRKFPVPDPHLLPSVGVIAQFEGKPVACGFIFKTDSKLAMIGNLSSDPEASSEARNESLNSLLNILSDIAKNEGYLAVTCATNLPKLMDRFEGLGFENTDKEVSHFRRVLCL